MSSLDQVIQKIPKPVLVGGVLILALAFFIYNDPLRDECEMQIKVFQKNTRGVLTATKKNNKIQFAQITYWKDMCRDGNSVGACADYLNGLRTVVNELKSVSEKCQIKYATENEEFLPHIANALQIIPLVAWGEAPPEGLPNRMGWLTEANVKTFCALKNTYLTAAGEESFLQLRDRVYLEYPDKWSDKVPLESRTPESRPKALKTLANPDGTFTKEKIYERSLFSIRCDLYM